MNASTRVAVAVGVVTLAAAAALVAATALATHASVVPKDARSLGTAPVTVRGIADQKGVARDAPRPGCAAVAGVAWYTVRAPRRGAVVARLVARGELDGALVVYRVVRSQREPLLCAKTNRHGRARLAWYAFREGTYLVGVGRRVGSAPGSYELSLRAAERAPMPPGDALTGGEVSATINSVLDHADAWSVTLERGVTYKLNLSSPKGCLALALYRPNVGSFRTAKPVQEAACAGYTLFTPGIDGGGVYSLVVSDRDGDPVDHFYRLRVGPAGADDTSPGVALVNGQFVSGTISGKALDAVDMYRFAVPHDNELTTLDLRQKANVGLDLLVLDETGGRVACACSGKGRQVLREHIAPGHYYAVVRSRARSGGRYGLQLFVRDVTRTAVSVNGAASLEVAPGAAVPLTVAVSSASHGGPVVLQIDRHDPLAGWQFSGIVRGQLDTAGSFATSWVPPSVGHWRARARFMGTPFSNFSESGYVHVHVAEPLE